MIETLITLALGIVIGAWLGDVWLTNAVKRLWAWWQALKARGDV